MSPPQISYECFEELIRRLRHTEHAAMADKLDFMIYKVAWTTGSELIHELGLEILSFQSNASNLPAELQNSLEECMSMVKRIWPNIGSVN